MNKQPVSYLQTDPRWGSLDYSAKGEKTTIRASGCGPTAMAMVLATWADPAVTPATECAWALAHGFKAPHQGTYYGYFEEAGRRYGLKTYRLNYSNLYGNDRSAYHALAKDALDRGDLVIACMGKGTWTSSGHYVLVWKIDGNVIYINDPASTKPHRVRGDYAVFKRQAKRISDRITATLDQFSLEDCYCFDSNDTQEYFICWGGQVLVHNYAVDAWYYYDNLPVSCMVNFQGELYYGDTKGRLNHFSYRYRTDNGEIIRSYWESGSLAFEQDFMRKYSSMLWVGIKPEEHGEVWVTVQTDRKSVYANKVVASSLMTFSNADFRRWSFNVNRKPHMARLKIKAKKFVFYKLIFSTESINTTTTILSADLRVRYTGYAR